MLLESICFIHFRRQQPYQSNNSECPQKSNVISTMAVQYLSMHNSRTCCGCNMKKTHLRLSFALLAVPSGLIFPISLTPSWWCQEITALLYFDSSAFPWQNINRCDVRGMCRLYASFVRRRRWYVVSTAGKGKGKFLWDDNRIGRHIKGLLRTEGNKLNSFHFKFQTDVI